MAFTTTELVSQVKRLAHVPTSQSTFQTADLLALADHIIRTKFLPIFRRARESYFSADQDYTITSANLYRIPGRAVAGGIKDAKLINGTQSLSLDLVQEEDVYDSEASPTGNPAFYFKDNRVVLVPSQPPGYTTLRLVHYRRPSKLVATSAAAQITAIDTGTNTLTFSSLPSTFTTSTALDLIRNDSPFECRAIDQTPTTVTTTTLVFSSLPSDLAVGDWVALAGETPCPQLPVEFHEVLAKDMAEVIHKSQGDLEGYKLEKAENDQVHQDSLTLMNPRVTGEPKKIISPKHTLNSKNRW